MSSKLFLLDTYALIYRAHFAFINRPLINSKGHNTSAITGFVRTVWDIIKNKKPTHIAAAFDLPGPTFRHELFPDYKANREEQPKDIEWSIPYIRSILEGMNITILEHEGMEADDIIGTVAKKASKEGFISYMVTPDKDYGQLVTDNIFMYKPSRQGQGVDIWGEKDILEKWDISHVHQVIDMLGLQGDASDNIPGVKGVGVKTAAKLLKQFPSIEEIYENIDEIKGSVQKKLIASKEDAMLSKVLATIKIDCDIPFDPKSLELGEMNRKKLTEVFNELEFRTLARDILAVSESEPIQRDLFSAPHSQTDEEQTGLPAMSNHNLENTEQNYQILTDSSRIKEVVSEFLKHDSFCFDTETDSIHPSEANIVGLAISCRKGEAFYIPLSEDREAVIETLRFLDPLWHDEKIAKIGQNIKYDLIVLKHYDINIRGTLYDTMIMHYLLEPEMRHNMDYLSESYLNYKPIPISQLIGPKGKNQRSMRDLDPKEVVKYACEDADITLQLYHYLSKELESENKLWDLYLKVEEPLIAVLAEMEHCGIGLDAPFLKEYAQTLKQKIKTLESEIFKAADVSFNIASPKQVGEVLFTNMKIPYRWRKTKSGQYSTSEEKLSELSRDYPIVALILEHRSLSKLLGTYVEPLPKMLNKRTGRLHSSFNQALTATGRLSSNHPNIQNIPIRTEEGRNIRKAFKASGSHQLILAADYSQIELRLIAEISQDEKMLEAFQKGLDIHTATAASVYAVELSEVSPEQRRNAKTVNFSIIYGAGAFNLSQQLDIPRSEASELIAQYFDQYQGIQSYMTRTIEEARQKGYVETLMGRRRKLRDINSRSSLARSNAERIAINTPIQGTAADMIKIAMANVDRRMSDLSLQSKLVMQVHDELVFEIIESEAEVMQKIIKEEMESALPNLNVPIVVEVGIGKNWLEAH